MSQSSTRLSSSNEKMAQIKVNGEYQDPWLSVLILGWGWLSLEKVLSSQQAKKAYQEQEIYILTCFFMGNLLNRGWMIDGNPYILFKIMTKPNMSRKIKFSGISPQSTILGLRNETPWSGFFWYLTVPPGKDYVHYVVSCPNPLKVIRF